MKLKLVVVDLELSKNQKRVLGGAVGVLVLGASAVALAGNLHTWNTGDTLEAADLNANFADVKSQVTDVQSLIPMITDWISYKPTVTVKGVGTVIHASTTGFWRRVGDTMEVSIYSTFPTSSCNDNSNQLLWSLPILPSGTTPDVKKLPTTFAHIGTMYVVSSIPLSEIGEVAAQGAVAAVAGDFNSQNLTCTVLGDTGSPSPGPYQVHLNFAIPIEGWTATTGATN